jgi:hypothetical protein
MVAVEPGLGEVAKPMVGGDLLGRQMAVIVIYGHILSVFVIKNLRGFGLQKKIFR